MSSMASGLRVSRIDGPICDLPRVKRLSILAYFVFDSMLTDKDLAFRGRYLLEAYVRQPMDIEHSGLLKAFGEIIGRRQHDIPFSVYF